MFLFLFSVPGDVLQRQALRLAARPPPGDESLPAGRSGIHLIKQEPEAIVSYVCMYSATSSLVRFHDKKFSYTLTKRSSLPTTALAL
jgi:hypothetical protein